MTQKAEIITCGRREIFGLFLFGLPFPGVDSAFAFMSIRDPGNIMHQRDFEYLCGNIICRNGELFVRFLGNNI